LVVFFFFNIASVFPTSPIRLNKPLDSDHIWYLVYHRGCLFLPIQGGQTEIRTIPGVWEDAGWVNDDDDDDVFLSQHPHYYLFFLFLRNTTLSPPSCLDWIHTSVFNPGIQL
jgi:hypothetical protein